VVLLVKLLFITLDACFLKLHIGLVFHFHDIYLYRKDSVYCPVKWLSDTGDRWKLYRFTHELHMTFPVSFIKKKKGT
jgi:hypothetical protein